MPPLTIPGRKVRALRTRAGLSQAALAERLGISSSYLNLIEHDRRRLTAGLLVLLAQVLDLDIRTLSSGLDGRLVADLQELFADPLFEGQAPPEAELREIAVAHPETARAIARLHQGYQTAQASARTLASQALDRQDLPGMSTSEMSPEQVTDFLQEHANHFPDLEAQAEHVWREGQFEFEDLFGALAGYLDRRFDVKVQIRKVGEMQGAIRRYDPASRTLSISEALRRGSRNFQLAFQVGLLENPELLDRLTRDPLLASDESRALGRVTLASYFAAAVLMPYEEFLRAAEQERYDLDVLQHRFRVNFEQACHRLCTLQRKGAEGVPFFMVRIDIAGNISKKFSANGVRFPRYGGICPLRSVHSAFLQPNVLRVQVSRLPDGLTFFSMARTIRRHRGGYHTPEILFAIELGCEIEWAPRLVYADGIDLSNLVGAVPVGTTCRLCERLDCGARAFPSIQKPLIVDENVRGVSFFAPADEPSSE
ncbi:MAG TPA: short-chain fatty acyl-CoA regulator family protein [Candidatus Eisenbacteria bacterium]|nr:short-chain fatty acyl-CoA regulator family protein [Candidatus Eisenbacteria bacterium]